MATKLFIGSLAFSTTQDALKAAFEAFGEVEDAVIINDRETGRSRGFGFVTFTNDDDATKAIDGMNDKELDGRTITVSVAREREDRPRPQGRDGGSFRKSW